MTELSFQPFDADNHYYEAEDAFTRHMDKTMAKRCMQWAEIDGRKRLLVGGAVNRFIPNPTFDPIARPGSLDDFFRGKNPQADMRAAFGELEKMDDHPEYRDRDARLRLMDQQGLDGCFMFPTLGVGMESSLENDLPAMRAAFTAFNRWLDEDWGFHYQERIFSAAYITLSDVDHAVAELEWALGQGARIVNLRASSVPTDDGHRSLGDPMFDPFWARVNEAGITVCFHSGDAGYQFLFEHWGLGTEFEAFRYDPLKSMLCYSPIADTIASIISGGVLTRFPDVRICTIETGSSWVGPLFQRMHKAFALHPHAFTADPEEQFRQSVWVSPYYEDDLLGLADTIGVDHMVFGSDFPHAEGLADPAAFVDDLGDFDDVAIQKIMQTNGASLIR